MFNLPSLVMLLNIVYLEAGNVVSNGCLIVAQYRYVNSTLTDIYNSYISPWRVVVGVAHEYARPLPRGTITSIYPVTYRQHQEVMNACNTKHLTCYFSLSHLAQPCHHQHVSFAFTDVL